MTEPTTVRREVSNFYAIIGGVVSAGSLISLVQKMFNVGLAPILAEFIAYYRKITHFFVDGLFFWVPFNLPDIYKDLYVLSFIAGALYFRASFAVSGTAKGLRFQVILLLVTAAYTALWSILLVGLLIAPLLVVRLWGQDVHATRRRNLLFAKMIVAMLAATVAFFALNSQL